MSNYLDQENDDEVFSDRTDELNNVEPVPVDNSSNATQSLPPPAPRRSAGRPVSTPAAVEEQAQEEVQPAEDEDDVTTVLSDARLRLEQGRLYETIMNHNIFDGMDADAKAIKNVEREIKKFAQQRMEIMLGMRQEAPKEQSFPMELFPFNSLEVEALKALAAAATQGASRDAEPLSLAPERPQPRRQTLNPIGNKPKQAQPVAQPQKPLASKPAAPVKRQKVDSAVQRILEEEGVTLDEINEVFDPNHKPLDRKKFEEMTTEEVVERNRQASRRVTKQVANPSAMPMPPQEQMEAIYTNRANQAAAHPQMQMIMDLLNKKKPST